MTQFTDMVSKFAHDKSGNGEGSSTNGNGSETKNTKKRTIRTEEDVETEEAGEPPTTELSTQVRKSLRLSSTNNADSTTATVSATSKTGPFVSRTISADSVKTRPHHKRTTVTEVVKKEETTVVRRGTQGKNPGYATPATYAHLEFVADIIDYDLDVLFVGINPGVKTSERGHHYAGPNNHFWPCLSDSGPDDDKSLPALTNMGLTNLIDRPSRMGNELSDAECRAAAPVLTAKIKKYRPRFVCFVSKQAWDMFSGVGLGLQTAWVSWDDTPEDDGMAEGSELFGADLEDRGHPIQRHMNEQGYRLAPYLESGPSANKLDSQLSAEGAPSPYVKRENGSTYIKIELKEVDQAESKEDIKMELVAEGDFKPVKQELADDKHSIKKELADDKSAIKHESSYSSLSSSRQPRYRGGVRGSRMFVMPSTSGRVTQYRKEDKLAFFQQLAELVRRDRQIRGVKAPWEQ
ncbi:hypothetical protein BGX24_001568 [Mortierella sp. AD032]|nr:hypothetical protein BGX24_001568 [Mortierella sp. AD032]